MTLVAIRCLPIAEITLKGIRTQDAEYEVDIILLATGFDAFTGSMLAMVIRGQGGLTLREKWAEGLLGLMVHGFPTNFMIYSGPYKTLRSSPTLPR